MNILITYRTNAN